MKQPMAVFIVYVRDNNHSRYIQNKGYINTYEMEEAQFHNDVIVDIGMTEKIDLYLF